jgi:Ku protein
MPVLKNHRPAASATATLPVPNPEASPPCVAPRSRGRPSWSGLLRLSLVSLPVKAYAAVSSTSTSHFHLRHAGCGQRISYAKHCPHHGPVEADAIVKGYEYAPDQYVVVEPQELEQLRPTRDKALVLEQFVAVEEVPPTFFAGRCLYLVPDGAAAQHPYGVLVAAFQQAGRAALGRVVLSNQRQLVLVRAIGRLLVLDVLHYPAQVHSSVNWEADVGSRATYYHLCKALRAPLSNAPRIRLQYQAPPRPTVDPEALRILRKWRGDLSSN